MLAHSETVQYVLYQDVAGTADLPHVRGLQGMHLTRVMLCVSSCDKADDPDVLVPWSAVEEVTLHMTQATHCPVCLYPPVAPQVMASVYVTALWPMDFLGDFLALGF